MKKSDGGGTGMKIKTSELTGPALDWAVSAASNRPINIVSGCVYTQEGDNWCPSTDWSQGGPIIERERITVVAMPDRSWQAQGKNLRPHFHNPTPLIAAMRCYVASKLGDEVELPEGLA